MATKQELAEAKLIKLDHLSIIKDYINDKTDIETYEAGDNVKFEKDETTGKIKINASLSVPYTFNVDEDGNLIAYFPDDASEEEMEEVIHIDENGNLILTV